MKLFKLVLILALSLILITSCSKKKEEAAKLEQEMIESLEDSMADTTQAVDTVVTPVEVVEEAPAEPAVEPMPKRPAGSGFTVQVAACEDENYARYLIDLYTNRGYEPFVSEFSIDGQNYFRVRIGTFENSSDAKALKDELAEKFTLATWIDYTEF